jgi:hypothetical protein
MYLGGKYCKANLKNRVGAWGLDLYASGKRPMAGLCEYGNEPSGVEFLSS